MKLNKISRIFVVWLLISFIPVFTNIQNRGRSFEQGIINGCFSHRNAYFRSIDSICAESSLLSDETKIAPCDISGREDETENVVYCIFVGSFVLSAAGIFFALMDMMFVKQDIKHNFMIKYIHDQNGQSVMSRMYSIKI